MVQWSMFNALLHVWNTAGIFECLWFTDMHWDNPRYCHTDTSKQWKTEHFVRPRYFAAFVGIRSATISSVPISSIQKWDHGMGSQHHTTPVVADQLCMAGRLQSCKHHEELREMLYPKALDLRTVFESFSAEHKKPLLFEIHWGKWMEPWNTFGRVCNESKWWYWSITGWFWTS